MVTHKEIEHEWRIHKLLITGNTNYKLLAFKLGQFDIYLQTLEPVQLVGRARRGNVYYMDVHSNSPYIAVVRTPNFTNVAAFIKEMQEFKVYRIFKSSLYMRPKKYGALTCNTITNALALRPGKTFYITSKDKELRDFFYKMALVINEEHKFGCKFDYDEYDYVLEIKKYNKPNGQIALIIIMSGEDMPNDYRTSTFVPRRRYQHLEMEE